MLFDTNEHITPTNVHTSTSQNAHNMCHHHVHMHTLTTVFSIVLEAVVKDEVDVLNKLHKRSNDKHTL